MKILELTNYSAGGCGVFARVKRESVLLAKKGYEIKIFSSNLEKGTNRIVSEKDNIEGIEITRFGAKKLGGESFLSWDFEKSLLEFRPDLIIAHSYRHLHTTKALKLAKKINSKIFLVTHAPFGRQRALVQSLSVSLYDSLIGKRALKDFNKIIAISKWEYPFLESLGAPKEKIFYIPNGIMPEFLNPKKAVGEQNKIIYTGRISEIKNLETPIQAIPKIKDKKLFLELLGPAEPEYLNKLNLLISNLNLKDRVNIINKNYNMKEQIKALDSSSIFILPSKSEGMPQSLIEAMARKKIVIASDNPACRDIIQNSKNGFLFETGNPNDLAEKINNIKELSMKSIDEIKNNAYESVKQFSWDYLIDKLDALIKE